MKRISMFSGLFFALLVSTHSTFAYQSVLESTELPRENEYRAGFGPQLKLTDGSGFNFTAYFDTLVNNSSSLRVHAGLGDTDFYTGASYKWIPIPDFENQPGIGARFGAIYGREGSESLVSMRVDPMISKRLEIDGGIIVPYGALGISVTTFKSKTTTAYSLVAGSEFRPDQYSNVFYGGEMGVDVKDSFSYIAGFVTIELDESARAKGAKD